MSRLGQTAVSIMDGVAWFSVIFIFLCLESALALYMNLTNIIVLPAAYACESNQFGPEFILEYFYKHYCMFCTVHDLHL